jgi:CDP-diacylglycerol pyrophosphatase
VRTASIVALAVGAAALGLIASVARAADPNALWKIVHGRCVPNAQSGGPAPCAEVTAQWAVLKDINGATQFLLIPTDRVTGIETPSILDPIAPNYFAGAWEARHFVSERAGHVLPREDFALAINPPSARSQEQLHIHIDCIRPEIRTALHGLTVRDHWAMLPDPLAGQRYAAMRIDQQQLSANPFQLLAQGIPGAKEAMGQYTLVLAGMPDGFMLLAGHVGADGTGHGEDLEDHSCAVGQAVAPS